MQILASLESEAACSAALQQAVEEYGIFDTASLQAVLQYDASDFARSLCMSLRVAPRVEPPAMTGVASTADKIVQVVAEDMVDIATAEAMIQEAMCIVSEAEEQKRAAEAQYALLLEQAELATARLGRAEERTILVHKSCTSLGRQSGRRERDCFLQNMLQGR